MSITPLPNHYAFENHPSVYDEESLTALEMCGRLGKKVNEVIAQVNGWNVPMISEVSPTGDKSGELDRATIQGKLDAGYAVQLAAGDYYLNGPLLFRKGYALRGESQTETVIHCEVGFLDHDPAVSVDHITVRDVTVRGPGSGIGFDISRKVSGIETGGRYANFSNVSIAEYDTCVLLGGCWCTNFTHCRFDGLKTCVEQRGGCNNVKYDHCMFLGPMDQKTSIGLNINATGGSENYGIYLSHCDFERHHTAIKAYCCVSLNITSIYAEGCTDVFNLDSCPAFLCDGGYISFPDLVLRGGRSNALPLYEKSSGTIRDVFVRVNTPERWAFMSTPDTYPVKTENLTVRNDGGGKCYANAQLYSSIYNGVTKMEEENISLNQDFSNGVTGMLPRNNVTTKDAKYITMELTLLSSLTLTTEKKIILHNGGPSSTYFEITIPAGTHAAWSKFQAVPGSLVGGDYAKLILPKNGVAYHYFTIPALACTGVFKIRTAVGEMIL